MLEWLDDNWLVVRRNVRKERQVWSWLGKLLRSEGEEPRVSEIFYPAVVQTVLLFGVETWVLLEKMARNMEGLYVGFIR